MRTEPKSNFNENYLISKSKQMSHIYVKKESVSCVLRMSTSYHQPTSPNRVWAGHWAGQFNSGLTVGLVGWPFL